MKEVVLDASVTLSWCFDDEDPRAVGLLDDAAHTLYHVPAIWGYEVVNGLAVAERRRRLTAADAERFMAIVAALNIAMAPLTIADLPRLAGLARQYSLASYDAAYLDLALRLAVPLATLDESLGEAAPRAGVELAV